MKIIFSPSKEMREKNVLQGNKDYSELIFKENNSQILKKLLAFSEENIASIMKIKGDILEKTVKNIKNFKDLESFPAISLYNGVAFKELELESYSQENIKYLNDNLYILSAFYGLSKPLSLLKAYRLDMTMKIFSKSLYDYWKDDINSYIEKELENDVLVNLASGEFSKIIDKKRIKNILNIDFKEFKDGKYSSVSSYSKQARGKFLNILIKNQIENINDFKNIKFNNYEFNLELSDEKNFIFSR